MPKPHRLTVSGVSSGGQMATQLHFAYADLFSGVAVLSGGPFGCAEGNLLTAMGRCMGQVAGPLPVDELAEAIRRAAAEGHLADPALVADDPVWLYRGQKDQLVAREVMEACRDLYGDFVSPELITWVGDVPAAHNFPTLDRGSGCEETVSPFLGACDYDAAGELLEHLHGPLQAPAERVGEPSEVPVEGAEEANLMDTAWVYRPPACAEPGDCDVHVVLHGCLQSTEKVDRQFVDGAGYLRWAAANDLVLVFPQVEASAVNPYGCWDWWGYTGQDYRYREGVQMKAVADLARTFFEIDGAPIDLERRPP